jgi:hypothetical protein
MKEGKEGKEGKKDKKGKEKSSNGFSAAFISIPWAAFLLEAQAGAWY